MSHYLKQGINFLMVIITFSMTTFCFGLATCPKLQANKIYPTTEIVKTDEDGAQWHVETINDKMPSSQDTVKFLALIWLQTHWIEGFSSNTCYCHGIMTVITNHKPMMVSISLGATGLREEDKDFCRIQKERGKDYMIGFI